MRIVTVILVGSVAALVASAPALAKHSESQKTDAASEASCHAYQQAADGSWTQVPCQESGNGSGNGQTQHRKITKNGEEERR